MSGGQWGKAEVLALVTTPPAIEPPREDHAIPDGFRLTARDLEYWSGNMRTDDGVWLRLCSRLTVEAVSKDLVTGNWGRLLHITDVDGQVQEWVMPMSLLASGNILMTALMDRGLLMNPSPARVQKLVDYIAGCRPERRIGLATKPGWHDGQFLLPDGTLGAGPDGQERIIGHDPALAALYHAEGTLDDWREEVSEPASGNSRLVLALCTAFAAPLIHPLDLESGGFHFRGGSSTGKSTALRLAASVWGGPQYVHRWRATDNGLEAVAVQHNDTLLALDEIGQLDPRSAGQAGYLLANGSGKHRSRRDGTARPAVQWRTLFLSTGEVGLGDRMAETGQRQAAGMSVRVLDVPADAEKTMGLFEDLHGRDTPAAFAETLHQAASRSYGTAGPAFVAAVCDDLEAAKAAVQAGMRTFLAEVSRPSDDGQVQRAARRFALVAAAGELAIRFGIVTWRSGEAMGAAKVCYQVWLTERGSSGPTEVLQAVQDLRTLIERDGASRFQPWFKDDHARPVQNRAGFVKKVAAADHSEGGHSEVDRAEYFILPSVWSDEIAGRGNLRAINAAMLDNGILVPDRRGNASGTHRPPSLGESTKLYHIDLSVLMGKAQLL